MRNDRTPCLLTGQIALRPYRCLLTQADVANMFISWYQVINGIGSIVNNDQLFVRVVLAQEVSNGLPYKCAPIVCRHDATHQGIIFTTHRDGCGRRERFVEGELLGWKKRTQLGMLPASR